MAAWDRRVSDLVFFAFWRGGTPAVPGGGRDPEQIRAGRHVRPNVNVSGNLPMNSKVRR